MYGTLVVSLGVLCYLLFKRTKLDHIPTVGFSSPLLSYISGWRFLKHGYEIIEEGYRKYPNGIWKFSTFESWIVVANGTRHVEEIAKAPEEQLSQILAFREYLLLDYTLGPEVTWNPYHIAVVRASMTRNIAAQFDDMRSEMIDAFAEIFDDAGDVGEGEDGWKEIDVHKSFMHIISRVLARLSVGYPLCENKEYQDLCKRAVPTLAKGRILRFFPPFLRPLVTKLFINSHQDIQRMAELLEPIVKKRLTQEEEYGADWPGKPEDILTWLLEESARTGIKRTALDMATRIYFLSFASEGSAMALTNALHELTSNSSSKYIEPLREEILSVLASSVDEDREGDGEGWTKIGISKMIKLDSFLREVQRCYDIQPLHLGRKALKDFTFSDGTHVPAGSTLYVNSHGVHRDARVLRDAQALAGVGARGGKEGKHGEGAEEEERIDIGFEGFRWCVDVTSDEPGSSVGDVLDSEGNDEKRGKSQEREERNAEDILKKPLLMKPTLDYHAFGYGKHACPGRFVAAYQMKVILAYLLLTYDVRIPPRPCQGGDLGTSGMRLEFRRRDWEEGVRA